jgi:hypothetical protein
MIESRVDAPAGFSALVASRRRGSRRRAVRGDFVENRWEPASRDERSDVGSRVWVVAGIPDRE